MAHEPADDIQTPGTPELDGRARYLLRLRDAVPALALAGLVATGCGPLPEIPFPEFADSFPAEIGTPPPMPTLAFPDLDPGLIAAPFSIPEVPPDTLVRLTTSPPAWWYLVPIHNRAHTAGSVGRDYHYLVSLTPEEMADYYKQAMRLGGWEAFFEPLISGSYAMLHYTRDTTDATIYVSPRDGGALVSILIE